MEIVSHLSWVTSRSSFSCNSNILANSNVSVKTTALRCLYGCLCPDTIPIHFYCIEYSDEDNWSYLEGYTTSNFAVYDVNTVTIGTASGNWIAPFDSARWNISTTFSVVTRTDTGQINSPPRVAGFPYVYLQWGYYYYIYLAVNDPDDDEIRCRWAMDVECAEVCNNFTGAYLDSESCIIQYSASSTTGLNVAAIMIEDFLPGSSVPLSSVAHQFLVQVSNVPRLCNLLPRFVAPALSQRTCVRVLPETHFTIRLTATSGCSNVAITSIKVIVPAGASKGGLWHSPGTNNYYRDVTWKPTANQQNNTHFLCYVAINSENVTSEQYCIKLAVGYYTPTPLPESATPNHQFIHTSNNILQIMFNRKIQRPSTSAYIKFYKSRQLLYQIDTSSSQEVKINGQNLIIIPNYVFVEGSIYYINFDEGVVKSIAGCNVSNQPILDKTFWNFEVIDITPSK